jgi:O-methyltransferase
VVEAGCWKGGGAIYAKACLSAFRDGDRFQRRLWCADRFVGAGRRHPAMLIAVAQPLLKLLGKAAPYLPYAAGNGLMNALNPGFPNERHDPDTLEQYFSALAASSWRGSIRASHFLTGGAVDEVRRAFARYELLDDDVEFLAGWFAETLPQAARRIDRIAVLRCDGDFYRSTTDVLLNLYPKLAVGGYCIVDDYGTFAECRRAVDEYRAAHDISEAIRWIDQEAVFWRRER